MNDFMFIDLCREIDVDDNLAVLETGAGLLIEYRHDAGGVRSDLIARHVQVSDLSDAFQIHLDLLECLSFRVHNGYPSGIYPCVMVTHPIFTGGCHDAKEWLYRGRLDGQCEVQLQGDGCLAVFLGDRIPLSGEVQRAGVIRIAIDLTAGERRSGQAEKAEDDDPRR